MVTSSLLCLSSSFYIEVASESRGMQQAAIYDHVRITTKSCTLTMFSVGWLPRARAFCTYSSRVYVSTKLQFVSVHDNL